MEVTSQENIDIGSDFICVLWLGQGLQELQTLITEFLIESSPSSQKLGLYRVLETIYVAHQALSYIS